jgi:hypothetical protein
MAIPEHMQNEYCDPTVLPYGHGADTINAWPAGTVATYGKDGVEVAIPVAPVETVLERVDPEIDGVYRRVRV